MPPDTLFPTSLKSKEYAKIPAIFSLRQAQRGERRRRIDSKTFSRSYLVAGLHGFVLGMISYAFNTLSGSYLVAEFLSKIAAKFSHDIVAEAAKLTGHTFAQVRWWLGE